MSLEGFGTVRCDERVEKATRISQTIWSSLPPPDDFLCLLSSDPYLHSLLAPINVKSSQLLRLNLYEISHHLSSTLDLRTGSD